MVHVTGTLKIRDTKGNERNATENDQLKPDEVVFATKKSSATFKADGAKIAHVTNERGGKNGTRVVTSHPLARRTAKPKHKLKATILKAGGRLILQAQRESSGGVCCYNLTVDLS